nr:hypothetical protein [Branchiibius hedensis]
MYRWLIRPNDQSPVEILRDSPYDLVADQLAGIMAYPDEQRGGVYGTAKQMATCLTSPAVAAWVTSPAQRGQLDERPQFDPHAFVRDGSTLYALSMEGEGTTGPLTTALTVAVTEAATDLATEWPAAGSLLRCCVSWTRPRTCAAGGACQISTPTSDLAESSS